MSFSRSGLTVCEYCPVVTFENALDYWIGCFTVDLLLKSLTAVGVVESKGFGGLVDVDFGVANHHLAAFGVDLYDACAVVQFLGVVKRSASYCDFDCFCWFTHLYLGWK